MLATLTLSSVLVADKRNKSFTITIPITCKTERENKIIDTSVLLDSGAGGRFMHPDYAQKHNILLHKLRYPIIPKNVDGTENKIGKITHFTWIRTEIDRQLYLERLLICNIGSSDIIFGLPWFQEYNPSINWKTGEIEMPKRTREITKEYYVKNQRRKKETSIPITTINKPSLKETITGRNKEETVIPTVSSTALQENIRQRESDINQNWRKKFIKRKEEEAEIRKEEEAEITIVHPEITTIFIKSPHEIYPMAQQLKKEIDTRLRRKPTMEEIIDEDDHRNYTQNPLPPDVTTIIEVNENHIQDPLLSNITTPTDVNEIDTKLEEEFVLGFIQNENTTDLWINKTNVSTELAKKENKKKENKTLEEMVPSELID